jgi:hypothetical protein
MNLELALPAEMEDRLLHEAKRSGLPRETIALRLLDQHLPSPPDGRQAASIALLEQWTAEDANLSDEEAAANAKVLRQLDLDRPSNRKLFTHLSKDSPE